MKVIELIKILEQFKDDEIFINTKSDECFNPIIRRGKINDENNVIILYPSNKGKPLSDDNVEFYNENKSNEKLILIDSNKSSVKDIGILEFIKYIPWFDDDEGDKQPGFIVSMPYELYYDELWKRKELISVSLTDKINKDDLIMEEGKPIVKCKEINDDENLIWESLDGKSSACENIRKFYKVLKRQSDLDKTSIKDFINNHNKNISKK